MGGLRYSTLHTSWAIILPLATSLGHSGEPHHKYRSSGAACLTGCMYINQASFHIHYPMLRGLHLLLSKHSSLLVHTGSVGDWIRPNSTKISCIKSNGKCTSQSRNIGLGLHWMVGGLTQYRARADECLVPGISYYIHVWHHAHYILCTFAYIHVYMYKHVL